MSPKVIVRVWWCDGRVTDTVVRGRKYIDDVIGGNAHPWTRYEVLPVGVV